MSNGWIKLHRPIVCALCDREICHDLTGEPYLNYKKNICYECYINLISEIYKMAGAGDGGIIHLIFKEVLSSSINRAYRRSIKGYRNVFQKLLYKYKFSCVCCGEKNLKLLSIDHIKPVSRGGTDEEVNLQILCRSCNSSKGNR